MADVTELMEGDPDAARYRQARDTVRADVAAARQRLAELPMGLDAPADFT